VYFITLPLASWNGEGEEPCPACEEEDSVEGKIPCPIVPRMYLRV